MAIKKEKKKEIYEKINDAINKSSSMVFVNFHGLTVGNITSLRKGLREQGVKYVVAKKTIIKRAFADSKTEGVLPSLDGELAIAYGEDLLAPAREVFNFQKKYKNNIQILGGVFEGKYMGQAEMTNIATIPGMIILRGQFVNLINSPIQQFVVALDQIAMAKEA